MPQPDACADGLAPPQCYQGHGATITQASIPMVDACTELVAILLVFLAAWFFRPLRWGHRATRAAQKGWQLAGPTACCAAAPRDPTAPVTPVLDPAPPPRSPDLSSEQTTRANALAYRLANVAKEGKAHQLRAIVADAHTEGLVVNAAHVISMLKGCIRVRRFVEGLAAYDILMDVLDVDTGPVYSLLLFCAVEAGELHRCGKLFRQILTHGLPSGNDFVNIVRCCAQQQDAPGLRGLLAELRDTTFEPDLVTSNRAIAACTDAFMADMAQMLADDVAARGRALDVVGLNTLMKAYAQAGWLERCFAILEDMRAGDVKASVQTYGIVLDACSNCGAFDRATEVFADMKKSGAQINAIHYTTYIKILISAGQFEEAKSRFSEMRRSVNLKPDVIAYSTLMKALCDRGDLEDSIELLGQMIADGIRPDTVVFHNLFLGLHSDASKPELVMHVFELMRREVSHRSGHMPSTTTLSVFLKCLADKGMIAEALDALETVQQDNGKKPQVRLYAQLAWACTRSRWGAKLLEVYQAMVKAAEDRGEEIDQATDKRLVLRCMQCGMLQTASDLCRAVLRRGGSIGSDAAEEILAMAARKEKNHLFDGLLGVGCPGTGSSVAAVGRPVKSVVPDEWRATPGLSNNVSLSMRPQRRL